MANVLPPYSGLAVNGVVYQYTAIKDPETGMVVNVQNENSNGNGYIFRETDDWSGLPGNTISKVVPVPYIDAENWGDGSIEVLGEGVVVDPTVVYTFRYDDTCVISGRTNPNCPEYVRPEIPDQEVYELDEAIVLQEEMDRQRVIDEDQERRDYERIRDREEEEKLNLQELEAILGTLTLDSLQGPAEILHQQMVSLNYLDPIYNRVLPDPGYEETIEIDGGELSDNRSARIHYARELLHQEMVNMQYKEK